MLWIERIFNYYEYVTVGEDNSGIIVFRRNRDELEKLLHFISRDGSTIKWHTVIRNEEYNTNRGQGARNATEKFMRLITSKKLTLPVGEQYLSHEYDERASAL